MPELVEIVSPLVETALTFAPWLVEVPLLGRILLLLSPGGGNEFKAIEELQRLADKKKLDRKTRIDRNARYVLKASDAMRCVELNLTSGAFLLSIGKGILDNVAGRGSISAADLVVDRIFTCIEEHTLKQTSARRKVTRTFWHRPSRGHGTGRH